ncbi:unnamed protein product, partial [Discosporangium mesarthrocarpum]
MPQCHRLMLSLSWKDMNENQITAEYIGTALKEAGMHDIKVSPEATVKKFKHVQHICREITARISPSMPKVPQTPSQAAQTASSGHRSFSGNGGNGGNVRRIQRGIESGTKRDAKCGPGPESVRPGETPLPDETHLFNDASLLNEENLVDEMGIANTGKHHHRHHHCRGMGEGWRKVEERSEPVSLGSGLVLGWPLLAALHPTPAVCGKPSDVTYRVIREVEGFDRGFYAGPVGFVAAHASEFGVGIRSALISSPPPQAPRGGMVRGLSGGKGRGGITMGGGAMTVFAGAGIVPGSTPKGEWDETGVKMKNFMALFATKPMASLQSLPTLNALWSTMVVEELARLGVRRYCVSPGARSAPLTAAVARHPGVVAASHHDERGAGFYAVGFARATGRPCAVVTTSGTAAANLLPAAAEASEACLPVLFLTADRPAESRGCGTNQTIDQVNIFGSRCRWFKDLPCPDDTIPTSVVLSDVDHAYQMTMGGLCGRGGDPGPVHLNFMFKENLAPTGGAVREAPLEGMRSEWSRRCIECPRIVRWQRGSHPFTRYAPGAGIMSTPHPLGQGFNSGIGDGALQEVADTLLTARRGLLVLGSLRGPDDRAAARHLAMTLKWPVFADICSGLRVWCRQAGLGVGRLDQMLLQPAFEQSIAPDTLLQVGWPLISKRVQRFMAGTSASLTACSSIICAPLVAWHDPGRSTTLKVACSTSMLAAAVDEALLQYGPGYLHPRSDLLVPLVRASALVEATQSAHILSPSNSIDLAPPVSESVSKSASVSGSESREKNLLHSPPHGIKDIHHHKHIHRHMNGHLPFSGGASPLSPLSSLSSLQDSESQRMEEMISLPGMGERSDQAVSATPSPSVAPVANPKRPGKGAPLTEPFVSLCVTRDLAPGAGLFLSASMPCRDVDMFADEHCGSCPPPPGTDPGSHATPETDQSWSSTTAAGIGAGFREVPGDIWPMKGRLVWVGANRGASGIDGVVSSAAGYAAGLKAPVTLLIGDMATLHDLGSLHTLRCLGSDVGPLTIVCVNNGGGGIFAFLPIAAHKDAFSPLFDTPHETTFEGVCKSLGICYRRVTTDKEFQEAYLGSQRE